MSSFLKLSEWSFACFGFGLMVVAALATPENAFGDGVVLGTGTTSVNLCSALCHGRHGEEHRICMHECDSTAFGGCPTPTNNPCALNSGGAGNCPGLGCQQANSVCWCTGGKKGPPPTACICPP